MFSGILELHFESDSAKANMEVVLCMLAERGILKILTANNATFQAAFDSSKHKEERIVNGAAKIIEVSSIPH